VLSGFGPSGGFVRAHRSLRLVAALTLVVVPTLTATAATAAPGPVSATAAPVLDPFLAKQLDAAAADAQIPVMLRADTIQAALDAVQRAGLTATQQWKQVAIAVAVGTPAQIRSAIQDPSVRYVQGSQPIDFFGTSDNDTTRETETRATLTGANGLGIDGSGVTVAVIDTGVDGTHPYFNKGGATKVVVNKRNNCPDKPITGGVANSIPANPLTSDQCFQTVPTNDSDTGTAGGHGTHVSGIAAGYDAEAGPANLKLHGAAPGAKLAVLSVNASDAFIGADSALNWVLDHHAAPCGAPATAACPPIKVVNNSYGPQGGGTFNAADATTILQRALVAQGVVVAWAAGNDGAAAAGTNPPGQDPTPGIVMVASYDDGGVGSKDNKTSPFSSRGQAGNPTSWPDVAAPGSMILSSCRIHLALCAGNPSYDNGDWQTISGTSMATPYIAGVVADLFQAKPTLTPAQVEYLLEDTAHKYIGGAPYVADPKSPSGDTSSYDKGHGLVDVLAATGNALNTPVAAYPVAPPPFVSCGGNGLVLDRHGDASLPEGPGSADGVEVEKLSMSSDGANVTTTVQFVDFGAVPPAGHTDGYYTVYWTNAVNGKAYALQATLPDPTDIFAYFYGEWDPAAQAFVSGTTDVATGAVVTGPHGTLTMTAPLSGVGATVPTPLGQPASFTDVNALISLGEGVIGIGLAFTAISDVAPDAGTGPTWAVCAAGEDMNGVAIGAVDPNAVVPEVPFAVLLPLLGLAAGGAVLLARRRRTAV
jgi:serine protease AprX